MQCVATQVVLSFMSDVNGCAAPGGPRSLLPLSGEPPGTWALGWKCLHAVTSEVEHVMLSGFKTRSPGSRGWNQRCRRLFFRGRAARGCKTRWGKRRSLLRRSRLSHYPVTGRRCPVCCPDIRVKQPLGVGQTASKHAEHLGLPEAGWQKAARVHLVSHANK